VVFSNTIKPYLLFQLGLAADGLYAAGVSSYWASLAADATRALLYGVQGGVIGVLLAVFVAFLAARQI
jgi:hypothetical protein